MHRCMRKKNLFIILSLSLLFIYFHYVHGCMTNNAFAYSLSLSLTHTHSLSLSFLTLGAWMHGEETIVCMLFDFFETYGCISARRVSLCIFIFFILLEIEKLGFDRQTKLYLLEWFKKFEITQERGSLIYSWNWCSGCMNAWIGMNLCMVHEMHYVFFFFSLWHYLKTYFNWSPFRCYLKFMGSFCFDIFLFCFC